MVFNSDFSAQDVSRVLQTNLAFHHCGTNRSGGFDFHLLKDFLKVKMLSQSEQVMHGSNAPLLGRIITEEVEVFTITIIITFTTTTTTIITITSWILRQRRRTFVIYILRGWSKDTVDRMFFIPVWNFKVARIKEGAAPEQVFSKPTKKFCNIFKWK